MIRIVTLGPFEEADIAVLSRTLYQAFGLGTEHAGQRSLPPEAEKDDGRYDAEKLIAKVEPIKTFADDKVLYLTSATLALREGPLGEPPSWSFAEYGSEKAIVSTARFPARGSSETAIEAWRKRLARESIHAIGHLWDLHHCYDARCAMHPPWSPSLPANPEADLCAFDREKSERRIRLAKT
ncbi:MAG TPA: archaemetzincin [Anaeromyxobacteraceae bacterium]|nr:archaemetzincin [Anaeromyxobacteraceae bacterium]